MPAPLPAAMQARSRLLRHPAAWPVLAALLVVSWSSGFVGTRLAAETAPVLLVLFWRMVVAGLALLPLALAFGAPLTRAALAEQMLFGVMGMFLYLGGFALAIAEGVPTGLVALIADLVPLAITVLSALLLGERLGHRRRLGIGLGVAGVLIVSAESLTLGKAPLLAHAWPVAGMLLFALVTVMQKKRGAIHLPIAQSLCIQCLTAAALFGLVQGPQGGLVPPPGAGFALGILWLVGLSTFLCYSVYYLCLRLYPPSQVASVVFLSPPVTMVWAAALFGEPLGPVMAAGTAVTFAGVWLAARPVPRTGV